MGQGISKGQIKIFEECEYGGKTATLKIGSYNQNKLKELGIRSNSISSIKIGPSTVTEIYENDKFSGRKWIIMNPDESQTKNFSCLRNNMMKNSNDNWDDRINSIVISSYKDHISNSVKQDVHIEEEEETPNNKQVNNKQVLEAVNKKIIMVKDLKNPLHIKNIDGLCVMRELLHGQKENLAIHDMENITKKCLNTVVIMPPKQEINQEEIIEGFNKFNNIDISTILFIIGFICTIIIILYFIIKKL